MTTTERPANRLIHEKSPYLLQHARNPVDWYPWGEDAFALARREDRPIFLSIGYSTCHWCHVMERESFESETVAEPLNRWFVPVKLDREERPDVDRLYMTAMQALGLGGGWPLNVFLTPDLEPFYGGTYFPPDSRHGRPGLVDVLQRVHEVWVAERAQVVAQGARLIAALREAVSERSNGAGATTASRSEIARRAFDGCFAALERLHDADAGGFGNAPKFPTTANLDFLAHEARRSPEHAERASAMLYRQLDAMRAGGIHDHLGGGFHRYSVDREWLVPHFEKMLYDQAQLAWAYLEGVRLAERPGSARDPERAAAYRATARGIFDYVARDLTAPEGGFWSAEDADSEGEEGRFYVWTLAELGEALGEDAAAFAHAHGATVAGNFEHGTNILHRPHGDEEVARHLGLPLDGLRLRLAHARGVLLERRAQRPRPHRDDKILTAWNGLMISAFARGARVLDDPALAARAAAAAEFVWSALRDPRDGALRRRWREGEAAGAGQLADYANFALGALDLFGATADPKWLERALAIAGAMFDRFEGAAGGGLFDSPDDPHVPVRMMDDYDGAELAGSSIAARVVETLAGWTAPSPWSERADQLFQAQLPKLASQPLAMPAFLVALMSAESPRHVVLAGDPAAPDARALRAELERLLPADEIVLAATSGATQLKLAVLVPSVAAIAPRDGRAAAYVCVGASCGLPITDPGALAASLAPAGSSP